MTVYYWLFYHTTYSIYSTVVNTWYINSSYLVIYTTGT